MDVNVGTTTNSPITYVCDMTNSLTKPTAVEIVVGGTTYKTSDGGATITKHLTTQTTAEKQVSSLSADTTYTCKFVFGTVNTVSRDKNLAELLCKFPTLFSVVF